MGEVHWRELHHRLWSPGCAACVMACPTDALGYTNDCYPHQIGDGMAHGQCVFSDRGCDICPRAFPRFRNWESDLDQELVGRERAEDEANGMARSILLTRATDRPAHEAGQDENIVSTLLIWGLQTERIEATLTSRIVDSRGPFDAEPFLAWTREDGAVATKLFTAGSKKSRQRWPSDCLPADHRGPGPPPVVARETSCA